MALQPGDPGFGDAMRAKYGRSLRPGDPEYDAATAWFHQESQEIIRRGKREDRISGIGDFFRMVWSSVIHMGMFSSDSQISRDAMILTAREQIAVQRAAHARERAEDQAREEERMRTMARVMAQEMYAEAERRRSS